MDCSLSVLHRCSSPPSSILSICPSPSASAYGSSNDHEEEDSGTLQEGVDHDVNGEGGGGCKDSGGACLGLMKKSLVERSIAEGHGPVDCVDSHLLDQSSTEEVLLLLPDPSNASAGHIEWRAFSETSEENVSGQSGDRQTFEAPPYRIYSIPHCQHAHKVQACWANFYDSEAPIANGSSLTYSPGSRSLCILSTPSMLEVHSSEGSTYSVPLPFQSDCIFPAYSHGLFIGRCPTEEDDHTDVGEQDCSQEMQCGMPLINLDQHGFDDSNPLAEDPSPSPFSSPLLRDPPPLKSTTTATTAFSFSSDKPTQMDVSPSNHPWGPPPQSALSSAALPSLFTLRHPLDELKPVASYVLVEGNSSYHQSSSDANAVEYDSSLAMGGSVNNTPCNPMRASNGQSNYDTTAEDDCPPPPLLTDAFEALVYVHGEQQPQDPVVPHPPFAVTYHSKLNRHAVWALQDAPLPSPPPPLSKLAMFPNLNAGVASLHNMTATLKGIKGSKPSTGPVPDGQSNPEDVEDVAAMALFAATMSSNRTMTSTHGNFNPLQSHSEALATALGVGSPGIDPLNATVISSHSNNSIVQDSDPTSAYANVHMHGPASTTSASGNQANINGNNNNMSTTNTTNNTNSSSLVNCSSQTLRNENTELHPHSALTCVWAESTSGFRRKSTRTFLATDMKDAPLLCLLSCKVLTLLCLMIDHETGAVCNVGIVGALPCLAAEPISAGARGGVDILLLTPEHEVVLYRGMNQLTTFALRLDNGKDFPITAKVLDLKWAVDDRVHVFYESSEEGGGDSVVAVRARVSLSLSSSSPLAETCLFALASTLPPQLSMTLRADCFRVCQCISNPSMMGLSKSDIDWDVAHIEDFAWLGVCVVLKSILKELGGNEALSYFPTSELAPTSSLDKLLNSQFHMQYSKGNPMVAETFRRLFKRKSASANCKNIASSEINKIQAAVLHRVPLSSPAIFKSFKSNELTTVFDTLHLVYEDAKLLLNRWDWLEPLSTLLSFFVECCGDGCRDFLEHYENDFLLTSQVQRGSNPGQIMPRNTLTTFNSPPSIMTWLHKTITNVETSIFPSAPPCDTSRRICRLYSILYDSNNTDLLHSDITGVAATDDVSLMHEPVLPTAMEASHCSYSTQERIVLALVDESMSNADLHNIPPGVALPILEAVHATRQSPPSDWQTDAYHLIGREDLALMRAISEGLVKKPKPSSPEQRFKASQSNIKSNPVSTASTAADEGDSKDKDGLILVTKFSAMLFNSDDRVAEVAKLLRSSKPIFLKVERPPEVSDHEYEQRKQQKLLLLCNRAMAAPIGRGMLTLGTWSPLLAELLPIPEICLAGRVPPNNATVKLNTTNCNQAMKAWPDFHNGVAAGLRLASNMSGKVISRTWIVYNKPDSGSEDDSVNCYHGGMLMALGLRKYLGALAMTDIYEVSSLRADTFCCCLSAGRCLFVPFHSIPPFTLTCSLALDVAVLDSG